MVLVSLFSLFINRSKNSLNWLYLSSVLLGDERIPQRPPPPSVTIGECAREVALSKGSRSYEVISDEGIAKCNAVIVPTSVALDLAQTEKWAEIVYRSYALHLAQYDFEKKFYEAQIADLKKPIPFWDQPSFWVGTGLVVGIGATVGVTYAVNTPSINSN